MNHNDSFRNNSRISIQPKHFSKEEIEQIHGLLSSKIADFLGILTETEDISMVDQKLNEISEVIMNSVQYPSELFCFMQLFPACDILLKSNNPKFANDVIIFFSMSLYSSKGLSLFLKDFIPDILIANEAYPSVLFHRRFFSFLTNFVHDLQIMEDFAFINVFINEYLPKIFEYISNHDGFYKEELRFLYVISSSITYETHPIIYEAYLDYLFSVLSECNQNSESLNTVLWSLFANYQSNQYPFTQYIHSKELIRVVLNSFSLMDEDCIDCVEPCLSIILKFAQTLHDFSFIQADDILMIVHYSFSENRHIRLLSLKLIRIISQHFPVEMIQMNIEKLFENFKNVEYELAEEIVQICITLLSNTPPQFFVDNQPYFQLLLTFLLSHISLSESVIQNGVSCLINIKEKLSIMGKLAMYDEIFAKKEGLLLEILDQSNYDLILGLIDQNNGQ